MTAIIMQNVTDKKQILRLVLPVGALIPSGVGLYLDNAAFATGQYVVCSPEGCLVELSVDENQLNAMRKAKTLSIVFKTPAPPTPENSQATQNIQLPLSTEGLAAALDGNALDPQTIVDEQKKLQEQLQKAADEARKALNANPAPAQ
jgi:invasion protein IalB